MGIKELQQQHARPGKVVFIGVRKERIKPVTSLESVQAIEGQGLEGDHYQNKGGPRQVTLIQAEHLAALSSLLGKLITPEMLRRNIVVEGLNLLALKGNQFVIGGAVLEYSGECHPCSRMETNLGIGGYNAMRGHGGITARVLVSGKIAMGDSVTLKSS